LKISGSPIAQFGKGVFRTLQEPPRHPCVTTGLLLTVIDRVRQGAQPRVT